MHQLFLFFTHVAAGRWTLNLGVQALGTGSAVARVAPTRELRFDGPRGRVPAAVRDQAACTRAAVFAERLV
jgi:hypothetical protein